MAININSGVEDAFYRYKMPKLEAKVEGKGNGIKTVIVNATKIGQSLSRDPIYVTKYFGCELGAQINCDDKKDRYIVNGSHEASKLQSLLDGFIKKFVLCQSCRNPETVLSVKRGSEVKTKCKACGDYSTLSHGHRLIQYIIKHPPTRDNTTSKPNKTESNETSKNPLVSAEKPLITPDEEDDDDWGEDASEEAKRKRMEELTSMAQSMAMSTDVEKSSKEKLQIFLQLINKNLENDSLINNVKLLSAEADKLELDTKAVLVLIEGILTDPETVVQDLKKYSAVFREIISECDSKVKGELTMIAGIVLLVGHHSEKLMSRSPVLLKTLYDEDIVSEEVILMWAGDDFKLPSGVLSKKFIKTYDSFASQVIEKSQVFIVWLKEAEEESTDEEQDDVEDEETDQEDSGTEVDEDDKQKENAIVNVKKEVVEEQDDDLDIEDRKSVV